MKILQNTFRTILNRDMDGNCFIHMFVLEIIKQHTCMLLRFALVSMSLLELVVLVVGLVIAVVLRPVLVM